MRNPARLRAIYFELRKATGSDVPAGDLLRLAHVILKSYVDDEDVRDDSLREPGPDRAFAALPVDEAMKDGGWRVLHYELKRDSDIDHVSPEELCELRVHIRKFLGPEWPQQMQYPKD
ncbi:MAG TPA: hypothetical protein VHY79_11520 [Rhizomicrobium sp.]|jgi:hypothetical protein|nr:hypothetical protein [Rhizomicrobium sp.]